jgi:hypothetical protein
MGLDFLERTGYILIDPHANKAGNERTLEGEFLSVEEHIPRGSMFRCAETLRPEVLPQVSLLTTPINSGKLIVYYFF